MGANNSQTNLEKIARALIYDATAFANQTITSLSSGTSYSLTVPAGTKYALLYLSGTTTSYIRYWLDGSTPTSNTNGIKRFGETAFDINGADDIKNFKFLVEGAGLTLNVQYFR